MTGLACLRDPLEDSRGGFMVVALEMDFDQCQVGERAPRLVPAQAELVGGVGDEPGELLGRAELAVDGRREGGDARTMNVVGDRAADRRGECSLDPWSASAASRPGGERLRSKRRGARGPVFRDVADRLRRGRRAVVWPRSG